MIPFIIFEEQTSIILYEKRNSSPSNKIETKEANHVLNILKVSGWGWEKKIETVNSFIVLAQGRWRKSVLAIYERLVIHVLVL